MTKAFPAAKLMRSFGAGFELAATLFVRVSMIEIVSSPLLAVIQYLPSVTHIDAHDLARRE